MNDNLFLGEHIRLAAASPEEIANAFYRWNRDMDYYLPLDSDPPRLFSLRQHKAWEEKWLEKDPSENTFFFAIRLREDDRLIGFIATWGIQWHHGESFVSLGIGEPEYRSKGYGTEAMTLMLRFCFHELNLRRVSLFVYDFNERGQRSYRKNGFVEEGRIREAVLREGKRWSWVFMGVLREDWESLQAARSPSIL